MTLRKGQTAMEYLMTYGWAILIIMVVVAVLFYMGVLNPGSMVPTQCSFPAGITCQRWKLKTDGTLYLKVGQGTGKLINVTGVACTMNTTMAPTGVVKYPVSGTQIRMPYQSEAVIADPTNPALNVTCTDQNGNVLTGVAGNTFEGKIYVNYTELDTNTTRLTTGSLAAVYEV